MSRDSEKKTYLAPLISVEEVEMEDVIASSDIKDMDSMPSDPGTTTTSTTPSYRTTFPGQ